MRPDRALACLLLALGLAAPAPAETGGAGHGALAGATEAAAAPEAPTPSAAPAGPNVARTTKRAEREPDPPRHTTAAPEAGDAEPVEPVEGADPTAAAAEAEDGAADVAAPLPAVSPAATATPVAPAPGWGPIEILGQTVPPGESRQLDFRGQDDFTAYIVVMRGMDEGPTLCVTAGVHGDELNGVAIARKLIDESTPKALLGTLIVAPIVNAHGFRNGSRYLPDRRDLNRYFPGRSYGSVASRIAFQFFEQVVRRCDALVDLHTGSLNRANLAQIRADLREVDNLRIAWGFGAEHVVHNVGQPGTLRRAANDAGIAAVLYEAGEPRRIEAAEIDRGVVGLRSLMRSLDMLVGEPSRPSDQRLYGRTHWVRSDASGIYVPYVGLGEVVTAGQPLAEVTDPFSTGRYVVFAPLPGRVIGMARGQVVIPGFALFHIGLEDPTVSASDAGSDSEQPPGERADNEGDAAIRAELAEERPE